MFQPLFSVNLMLVLFFALMWQGVASACELSMGYRTNERLPLIQKYPDNSGLYQELYTLAAEKIGCKLKIIRGPKKRILHHLYNGHIDFYPGFNFSEQRFQSVFYIKNGLPGGDAGISRLDLQEITNLNQLKGLTYITALGSFNIMKDVEDVNVRFIREMTVDQAILLIKKKRGDFYIYNKSTLEYYLRSNKITDIKIHANCCGGIQPLYLGFSRKSIHYQEIKNPDYRPQQKQNIANSPTTLKPTSVAYQFQQALLALQEKGITEALYAQYYLQ